MKKLLLILCLIFLALPVFAEYKPIPADKSAEYKAEIEQYVKSEIIKTKHQIEQEYIQANKIYNNYLDDNNKLLNKDQYIINLENCIRCIDIEELRFYYKMCIITNKYVEITNDIPKNEWIGDHINLLLPYLKDNKINCLKDIYKISFYANKKCEKIKKLIETINK